MTSPNSNTSDSPTPPASGAALRQFGSYALLRLLGKSESTMVWQAQRRGEAMVMVMPRKPLAADVPGTDWMQRATRAARLTHPQLAPVVEHGIHENWPFVAHAWPEGARTLRELLGEGAIDPRDAAGLFAKALNGLAYAHEAGVAHRDVQAHSLLFLEGGAVQWLGLEGSTGSMVPGSAQWDSRGLQAQRAAVAKDVLACGLLLHWMLGTQPALDETDPALAEMRMSPRGKDFVRLPWSLPRPVPEPLRAIVNRACDRQPRQRYQNARTMVGALEGWLTVNDGQQADPLALLSDRLHRVGVLPASPGGAQRAARLGSMEGQRTIELAEVVLGDVALSFELLRAVNLAAARQAAASGRGIGTESIITVRRSIAMLGLEGVRRAAATLREWPGPMNEAAAGALLRLLQHSKRAARLAQRLRPPGYDPEVVYLVALMQNLGRLIVQYHFPEEASQIRKLMQPYVPVSPEEREEQGMSEEAAAYAVIGTDIESIGATVARHWGLDDGALAMARRHALGSPVRQPANDAEYLRATASCAHEALDAIGLPVATAPAALLKVSQRYARVLGVSLRDLQAAVIESETQGASAETLDVERRLSAFADLDEVAPALAKEESTT